MYTVSQLVDVLHLETENQVRNRLNALRDQLVGHLRRGPNNQLLVTETGLELLRSLQALCETGYTLREASSLVRYNDEHIGTKLRTASTPPVSNQDKQGETGEFPAQGWTALVRHLADQVNALDARVAALEASAHSTRGQTPWWETWR